MDKDTVKPEPEKPAELKPWECLTCDWWNAPDAEICANPECGLRK
jgi:hypothetical protein